MRFFYFLCVLSLISSICAGQVTKVRGRVTDAETGEPLPLVTVTFPGTVVGTTTDFEGFYYLETREEVVVLVAMLMSYAEERVEVIPGAFNEIDFELKPDFTDIETILVRPGDNPAHAILKNISRNKWRNDPDQKDSYAYSTYTKMEMDIANMRPEFRNKKMQKNFGFVFDYMDTSALTGRAYLPIMITESTAEYYYRKNPRLNREIVKASRISGVEQDFMLAQFTGHLYVNVNLYSNYINIFEVNFASPASDHGLIYYNYFLVDSSRMADRKIYHLRFHPKNLASPVFDGEFRVDSTTWAITSARIRMARGVNVNWIRDLLIENTYQLVDDSTWFVKQDKILADFSIQLKDSSKMASFMGHRQIDYSDIRFNPEIPPEIVRMTNNVVMDESVLVNDEAYWQSVRPQDLSEREKNIYIMVDSIKNAPLYKSLFDMFNTVLFGYYPVKKIEFGPYYKLYSFNKLEGNRFQLGARTNKDFSRKIRLSGYGAYGTDDKEWKGGGSFEYLFGLLPMNKLTVSGRHDVKQLGTSENAFTTGNIMGSIFSRRHNDKLTLIDQFDVKYEREWTEGMTNVFAAGYGRIHANPIVPFRQPDGTEVRTIGTAEVRVGTRISKDEIVIRKDFDRTYMGSEYPIVGIDLTAGLKGVMNSDYAYYRTELSVRYNFNVPPIGRSYLTVGGGKVFGKVPFPLLKLHEGNATYFYDPLAFSCMNFYEFASDLWGFAFYEHHFRGLFLGRIPLLKRLKWREVITVKALWGTLSDRNNGSLADTRAVLLFPDGMSSVSKPYVEAGVGIENIFRLFRVDAMWRMTHREGRSTSDNFAVNFSFNLNF